MFVLFFVLFLFYCILFIFFSFLFLFLFLFFSFLFFSFSYSHNSGSVYVIELWLCNLFSILPVKKTIHVLRCIPVVKLCCVVLCCVVLCCVVLRCCVVLSPKKNLEPRRCPMKE